MDWVDSILRWIHVVSGIMWIGLLYFFNFVNIPFTATLGDNKKAVLPELAPRTLFWFRWGAAFTWISGALLVLLVFYHGAIAFGEGMANWTWAVWVAVAITFVGVFVYDILYKTVMKKNDIIATVISLVLLAAVLWFFEQVAEFSYRGYVIHLGAMFGTMMAFNVWFRIWPAQQKVIPAIKNGETPDADLAALAAMRSKHNTYMSVPLVWAMLNSHTTTVGADSRYVLWSVIVVGWLVVTWLYRKSARVPGF